MKPSQLRAAIVADFTVGGLVPFLTSGDPPHVSATVAPFDQVVTTLLDETADCWNPRPDVAVVWTRPHAAIKSFGRLLDLEQVERDELLGEVDRFADCLRAAATRVAALLVPTWTWPSHDRGLGVLNVDPARGPGYWLMRMNARLAEALADDSTIHVLDAGRWMAHVGATSDSAKLWHLGKIPFSHEVFSHAAADVKAAVRALRGQTRKIVVLDLDDTLWGGIVGDVGWQNLNLGGHSPIGEAFVAFQRGLKRLIRRGVVLAIVSKNTEAIALEAIDSHPEMVLRRHDFAGWRIDWNDKAQNILALTADLKLGLESVVFIDDNPAERARVREALPEVLVPDWPSDKLIYAQALSGLTCFDALAVSEEDQARTRMYASERARETARQTAQSMDSYLASLSLEVRVEDLEAANLVRATQLLNKTNQMNLTTRRMTEAQFLQWSGSAANHVFVFRVSDRFDDYGLTGIASLVVNGSAAEVLDFVLSCRVMGRGIEQTMLYVLAEHARMLGLATLSATYLATPRNMPCGQFFGERSGFASADASRYVWDLTNPYPVPAYVALRAPSAARLPADRT